MRVEGNISVQGVIAPDAAVRADAPAPRLGTTQPPQRVTEAAAAAARRIEEQVRQAQEADPAPIVPDTRSRIRIDEASNRYIAQVVNENNEVIRQYPPEAILQFTARFRKLQGLLFDERA